MKIRGSDIERRGRKWEIAVHFLAKKEKPCSNCKRENGQLAFSSELAKKFNMKKIGDPGARTIVV